jgi:hypothetical protein
MFLRFEATVGFACRRSELKEVVERFVESASFFSSFDIAGIGSRQVSCRR